MSRLSLLTVINADGTASLTLNRPDQDNRLDAVLLERITESLQRVNDSSQVRAVLLRGNGPDFCGGWGRQLRLANADDALDPTTDRGAGAQAGTDSGADRHTSGGGGSVRAEVGEPADPSILDTDAFNRTLEALRTLSKPVIAEIHGSNLGPALALAAGCDCVLAAETARFRLADHDERTLSRPVLTAVAAAIGGRQVRRYLLTAESMSAVQAQSLGLVQEVLPAHGLERGVREMLHRLRGADAAWQAKARSRLQGLGRDMTRV